MADISLQNLEAFIGVLGEALTVFGEATSDLEAHGTALTSLTSDANAQLERADADLDAARTAHEGARKDTAESLDALRAEARDLAGTHLPAAAGATKTDGAAFVEDVKASVADLDQELAELGDGGFERLDEELDTAQEALDEGRRSVESSFTVVEAGLRGLEEQVESEVHGIEERLEASTEGSGRRRDRIAAAQETAEDERENAGREWDEQCETLAKELAAGYATVETRARDAAALVVEQVRVLVVDGLGEELEWSFENDVQPAVMTTIEDHVDAAAAGLEELRSLLAGDRDTVGRLLDMSIELGKARQVEATVSELLEALNS